MYNHEEESYFIYSDPTVLPPANQSEWDRQTLEEFRVPDGHRLLNRAQNPLCTMGYAVTNIGAQKLLYYLSLGEITRAVDIEIARLCVGRSLRCLEVNPPLIGLYRPAGSVRKISDNIEKEDDNEAKQKWRSARENPMGERSVKSMMERIYGKRH